jgi:5-carboxymethyl-2-hydroxymuconate isomerase
VPHLILHYTDNLNGFDVDATLRELNRQLADSGEFDELAIKSRALPLAHYRIGVTDEPRGFVHALLKILPGRSEAVRQSLSRTVLATLQSQMPDAHPAVQLCVEVEELDARFYSKLTLDAT